jgi:hypothetical protein
MRAKNSFYEIETLNLQWLTTDKKLMMTPVTVILRQKDAITTISAILAF